MAILGIGIDLVSLERIQRLLNRFGAKALQRILTPRETQLLPCHPASIAFFLAKQFAAKEALVKALGTGFTNGIGFQQIEILRMDSGKPYIELTGSAKEHATCSQIQSLHVSLSDDRLYAFSCVIAES